VMGDQSGAQTDTMSHQLLGVSTPPATSKRSHSQDSNLSESSRLTTPGTNGNSHYPNNFTSQLSVKVPWYLNQQRAQIQKRFQDLEWHQRFRLQHGYINPDTSPFRMDRSDAVVSRNRYGNIQPWDPSRVRLRMPIGGSDYINASPISLKSHASTPPMRLDSTPASMPDNNYSSAIKFSEMRYIATQGPKDDQFAHFWNMVMQETVGPVGVIVMLTQCYEGIREKCSQYFPHDLESPVLVLDAGELAAAEAETEIGDPSVLPKAVSVGTDRLPTGSTMDGEIVNANEAEAPVEPLEDVVDPGNKTQGGSQEATSTAHPCSGSVTLLSLNMDSQSRSEVRHMRLEIEGQTKEIYHYLFNGWPDYGKPEGDDRRALLELARQTRERARAPETSGDGHPVGSAGNPRFVHCSAGVGRTGTFIALDWLLFQLEEGYLVPKNETLPTEQDINAAAYQENSNVNGSSIAETWGKSGPAKGKEGTPEATNELDLIFDTVNKLREQRMMMVMNEIQYSFLYEVMKEAFVEKYSRALTVEVVDVGNVKELNSKGEPVRVGDVEDAKPTPGPQAEDALSEAETEIEGDPYQAVAPEAIRAEMEDAKGAGAE
jgi:protein-tyrosine phosphatase